MQCRTFHKLLLSFHLVVKTGFFKLFIRVTICHICAWVHHMFLVCKAKQQLRLQSFKAALRECHLSHCFICARGMWFTVMWFLKRGMKSQSQTHTTAVKLICHVILTRAFSLLFFFLLKEIRFLHSPVVLGQLDRKDDAGDEEHYAPSQTEPEGILKREQTA